MRAFFSNYKQKKTVYCCFLIYYRIIIIYDYLHFYIFMTLDGQYNNINKILFKWCHIFLDFINVEEMEVYKPEDVDERVVEQSIVQNIKKFIMTFGRDFAYIGNQYNLEIYTQELFPDLLFLNRELNCMIVVELKKGAFKPGYIGQLHTYMKVLDDKVHKPHESLTIGILLCKSADKAFVKYVIRDYNHPMGVATYKTVDDMDEKLRKALPDMEKMRDLLTTDEETKT